MSKRIHLICNAHLDPVWQWEWEEGAAETLSTFRVAARFCEEYGDFVFNHNEALLYRWIEEFEPALFARIQKLVHEGKWHIMGGWHVQPDCNMPSGEGFVRQIQFGRSYFREKFGVEPTTAINFDPFGHTRGLVQILRKSGFDSYLFGRPSPGFLELPADLFTWVGYDGSEITACRHCRYNSALGKATEKIRRVMEQCPENDFEVCLWGVGDHGGGPSEQDLNAIAVLKKEAEQDGITLLHSTPEAYFRAVRESGKKLPRYEGDLNPWSPGCYTSTIRVKQKYRLLESTYLLTEQMAAAAACDGKMVYPKKELEDALYDLLTVQFHDMLPGSSIQPAEDMALRMLDHGLEILSRVKARAFFALSAGQKKPTPDKIPILLYNPHPFPVEGDFSCEMMLWDQNWADEFSMPQVWQGNNPLPTQCEKEHSSLNLDWRKRVVFHATLQPMQMNRFDCSFTRIAQKPVPAAKEEGGFFVLENERVRATVSRESGWLTGYAVDGKELLNAPCALHVVADNCDPWGMRVTAFPDRIGTFRLLTPEENGDFCGLSHPLPGVRCVESGDVRTVLEASLGYDRSRAVIRYTLSARSPALQIDIRIQWAQTQKMLKFGIPTSLETADCIGEVAYGEEKFPQNGRENCAQKFVRMDDGRYALSVCTDSVYGNSAEDGTLYMTLLRSAAYCAHPIDEREILAQDRYTPHMEQGERSFTFRLLGGDAETVRTDTPREAWRMHLPPMALSFYPPAEGTAPTPPFTIDGDKVEQTAFKCAEDGNGYILRLYNPFPHDACVTLNAERFALHEMLTLHPFEVKTYRITARSLTECDLIERTAAQAQRR